MYVYVRKAASCSKKVRALPPLPDKTQEPFGPIAAPSILPSSVVPPWIKRETNRTGKNGGGSEFSPRQVGPRCYDAWKSYVCSACEFAGTGTHDLTTRTFPRTVWGVYSTV